MKVLVAGGNGQVGYCLNRLLEKAPLNYVSFTRGELDIADAVAVDRAVAEFRPDVIINAAAYTAVDRAEIDIEQAFKVNADGARNLAVAANSIGAAIFHISTDYVFAGDADSAYRETDPVAPTSVYGESKLKGEREVIAANPKHIVLRTAWVFAEHGNNFVKTMVRLGREKEQLGVVGDQVGGPTYAGDIAQALLDIASRYNKEKQIPWGVYHFSGFPHVSWFEFASAIFSEVERENIYDNRPLLKKITTADYPTPAKRPANSRLDCGKIQANFNIQLSDWKQALKNVKAYS